MAAAGEMAEPSPNDIAPYSERVQNLAQVEVGELVVVRPIPPGRRNVPPGISVGGPKIQRITAKVENVGGSPALSFAGLPNVKLNPRANEFIRFEVYKRPAGPAAAGAGGPAGGKRRRKTKKASRRRRSTRRWFY